MFFTQWLIAAVFLTAAVTASAQAPSRVSSTDKVVVDYFRFDQKGHEIYVASTTPRTLTIEISADGRTINYNNGYVEKFDKDLVLIESSNKGVVRKIDDKFLQRWMPANRDSRESHNFSEKFNNPNCGGDVTVEWKGTPKDGKFKLMHSGKEIEVDVVEYEFAGRWTSVSCGIGRNTLKLVYAPTLDVVVERDFKNFRPDGLLNVGNANKMKSVN